MRVAIGWRIIGYEPITLVALVRILTSSRQRPKTTDDSDACSRLMLINRYKTLPLFEFARVLVRLDHVARLIMNANHSVPVDG